MTEAQKLKSLFQAIRFHYQEWMEASENNDQKTMLALKESLFELMDEFQKSLDNFPDSEKKYHCMACMKKLEDVLDEVNEESLGENDE